MDSSPALEKELTEAAERNELFEVLLRWLGHRHQKKRQAATRRLCELGSAAVQSLILAAIEPAVPSQHVLAILDVIERIGGALILSEKSSVQSLLRHGDPDVRRKAEQVIVSLSPSNAKSYSEEHEPRRGVNPHDSPPGKGASALAVASRGVQALARQAKSETPPVPVPSTAVSKQQAVMARIQRKANVIRTLAFPAAMAAAIPVAKDIGSAAFKVYQDGLLQEAGGPTDPVERMLLEQLTLAHHRVAQLHAQAESAKSIEAVKVFSTAAARLTGEVRRLALALKQYREPSSKKHFTVVRQQNVSAGGQQIAYLDQNGKAQGQIPFNGADDEQGNSRLAHAPQTKFLPESQATSRRPKEPDVARAADRRGTRTSATGRPNEQALVEVNGADNRCW